MKKLCLVGESLPDKTATPFSMMDDRIVAIDPRHGVFPNLVAKPILAAMHSLHKEGIEVTRLLDQLESIMVDEHEDRRFNVFKKTYVEKANKDGKTVRSDRFSMDSKLANRIRNFAIPEQLWLVYGVQTNYGLLGYQLGLFVENRIYTKDQIVSFARKFIRAALAHKPKTLLLPQSPPTQRTALLGILHRLCCEEDRPSFQARSILQASMQSVVGSEGKQLSAHALDEVVTRLRNTVPLLHNEAYQDRHKIGHNQAHFVLCRGVEGCEATPQLYWRVMGHAIACRLQDQFVER